MPSFNPNYTVGGLFWAKIRPGTLKSGVFSQNYVVVKIFNYRHLFIIQLRRNLVVITVFVNSKNDHHCVPLHQKTHQNIAETDSDEDDWYTRYSNR